MNTQEALALAERAIRRGSCSAHKVASDGCATCEAGEEAIRVLRAIVTAPEVDEDDDCGGCGPGDCECSRCRRARALRGTP